ncbi:hypothetical protein, partial [uncultured Duncaniella sp.]|uniref:hypothetical protein n=1 Tax=uncultured Duncaniella sp. TaxID=2768039 RepID=UPI002711F375
LEERFLECERELRLSPNLTYRRNPENRSPNPDPASNSIRLCSVTELRHSSVKSKNLVSGKVCLLRADKRGK